MGLSTMRTTKKKKAKGGGNRFLITVNVLGSTGPIRLVVKGDDDDATAVIRATLRIYAREGRLPLLGSDAGSFFLYPAHAGFQARMSPTENIGSRGERRFVLSKKERSSEIVKFGKGRSRWRAWLHNSLTLKILSHQFQYM